MRNRLFLLFGITLVLLMSVGAAIFAAVAPSQRQDADSKNYYLSGHDVGMAVKEKLPRLQEPVNILVVGIDKAKSIKGEVRQGPWRSDVIILARLDPLGKKIGILSIPRDTRVNIPGYGLEKMAHAHAYGEMPLTVETVEMLTGVDVDHFVRVDYEVFARMVNIMGGIDIDVEKELTTKHFQYSPGRTRMDGKQAYEYVTNRDEPLADIARIGRQQIFLFSLLDNIKERAGVIDLARMYLEFKKTSETTLSMSDTLKLARFAREIDRESMVIKTVPGGAQYIGGLSYWISDNAALETICKELFPGKSP